MGFLERDIPRQLACHAWYMLRDASPVSLQRKAFADPRWIDFMTQLQIALPVGARRWTLYNLSFIILVIKARLTFSFNLESGKAEYGKLEESCYPITKYESVRAHVIDIEKRDCRDFTPRAEISCHQPRSHSRHLTYIERDLTPSTLPFRRSKSG